jgi:hypothetical protein
MQTFSVVKSVLYGNLRRILSIGRELRFSQDLSVETEESPLLEAVTRKWLVKTQQAGKDLACAVEISDGAVITCSSELCE